MSRATYRVDGRVQGVGFRFFVVRLGRSLGLRGGVRNEADGSVLCWAEGDEAALEDFRRSLVVGPSAARVEGVAQVEAALEPGQDAFDTEF